MGSKVVGVVEDEPAKILELEVPLFVLGNFVDNGLDQSLLDGDL